MAIHIIHMHVSYSPLRTLMEDDLKNEENTKNEDYVKINEKVCPLLVDTSIFLPLTQTRM